MTQSHTLEKSVPSSIRIEPVQWQVPAQIQSKTTRVCHVSMCLTTGGLERLLVEFARRTNAQQYDLQFAVLGDIGQPAEDIRAMAKPVTQIQASGSSRWGKITKLRRLFIDQKIDVVHSHNTYAHFYASIAAFLAGVPVVLNTQHGRGCGESMKQRSHFFLANRLVHQILAVSEDSAKICQRQDPLSRSKIVPLWNGIDLERFSFHGPRKVPHAICVARLSPEKDFPTLLNATRLVIDQHPDFQLTIVGDGQERVALEKQCEELEIASQVNFLGERSDIPDLLKQAGMFVSSSSTEGISLTLLEAMAVGLPIVTTNVGGTPEIIEDGATGYLVPSRDPQKLADAISLHLNQPDTWDAIALVARTQVEKNFHINRMIADYETLYSSLLVK